MEVILSKKRSGAIRKLDAKPTWLVHVEAAEVFLVVVVEGDGCASQILRFLRDLHDLCVIQFGVLSVKNLNDNIVWLRSVLHAVITGGVVQPIEKGILEAISKKSLEGVSNSILQTIHPKMSQASKKRNSFGVRNEVFIDFVNKVDLTLSRNGEVVFHNTVVDVLMKGSLNSSDKHHITLAGNGLESHATTSGAVFGDMTHDQTRIEVASFHPCVDLLQWRTEEKIQFFPPSAKESIQLMSFRAAKYPGTVPFIIHTLEREANGKTRAEMEFKIRANFPARYEAQSIVISIPCPPTTSTVNVYNRKGKAKYKPEKGVIRWKIPAMTGQTEEIFSAEIRCITPTESKKVLSHQPPISISFEIPSYNCTGIRLVHFRNLHPGSREVSSFVKHTTRSGSYQCRAE